MAQKNRTEKNNPQKENAQENKARENKAEQGKLSRAKEFGAKGIAKAHEQKWEESEKLLSQSLVLYESIRGKNDEKVIVLRDHWALSLHKAKLYDEAIGCNEESLKRRITLGLKANDWILLENRRHLARNYDRKSNYEKALEQYRAILQAQLIGDIPNQDHENTGLKELCEDALQYLSLALEYAKKRGMTEDTKTLALVDLDWCDRALKMVRTFTQKSGVSIEPLSKLERKLSFASKEMGQLERSRDYLIPGGGVLAPDTPSDEDKRNERRSESNTANKGKDQADNKPNSPSTGPTDENMSPHSKPEDRRSLTVASAGRNSRSRSLPPPPDPGVGRRRSVDKRSGPRKAQADNSTVSLRPSLPSGLDTCVPSSFSRDIGRLFGALDENQADKWFFKVEATVHTFLDRHQQSNRKDKIKIAVLDTGVAIEALSKRKVKQNIKNKIIEVVGSNTKLKGNNLGPQVDDNGHGTDCFCLLMRVCPYAVIYPYRIVADDINDASGINPEYVNEALNHAINKRKVDIVSMSFGWEYNSHHGLSETISESRNVLMFAATSNDGGKIKYPANADEVIGIDAAQPNFEPSDNNPSTADTHPERFSAIGEDILSVVQKDRRHGTSFATPVAAGTAALLLEFAKQPPLCYFPEVFVNLKRKSDLLRVFRALLCREKSRFKCIDITKFKEELHGEDEFGKNGQWYLPQSQRYKAAMKIVDVLRAQYGPDFAKDIEKKCLEEYQASLETAA